MADKIDTLISEIQNLVKVVAQNNASLLAGQKGSGNGRYSTGMFGYSNMLTGDKNAEQLVKMFEAAQKTNAQTASIGGRIFKDIIHQKRDIEALNIDLKKNTEEYKKAKEALQKTLNSSTEDASELFNEAINKLKDLGKKAKDAKDELDKLTTTLYNGKTDNQKSIIEKAIEKIKNSEEYQKGNLSKAVADNVTKTDRTKGKFSNKEIEDYIKKQEEVNSLVAEEKKLHNDTNKAIESGTDKLNKQMYQREQSFRIMNDGLSSIKRGFTDIYNIGKQFANAWMKIDTASSNFARSIGMGSAGMAALRINTIGRIANTNLSDKYGVGMEDLVKLQAGYTSAIGRNIGLSNLDQENAIAMNVVMGERGGQLAANLENFGLSYSDAAKTAGKMFKDAGKYGLSFEKYSENFLQNIKIAQNYTFKNGLKGLESMAKKATAIKLDMQQVSAFAEKVGTLQGSVETAAQLQVLGGPFAQFSDPLGMLNESMTNMEGLIDRFTDMVGGLGRFNSMTGQIDVSAFNKQRIRAAAQAMGMDYGQVMESVQAQGRRKYIEKALGRGWTDDEREFIMNTSNIKEGKPMLSYIDAKGNRVEKDISSMSQRELEIARQQNQSQSDDIKNIAVDTRQMAQQITGVQSKAEAVRAKGFEGIHKTVEGGISLVNKHLNTIVWLLASGQLLNGLFNGMSGVASLFAGGKGIRATGGIHGGGFGAGLFGKGNFGRSFDAGIAGHRAGNRAANYMGRNFMSIKGLGIGLVGEVAGEIAGSAINKANEENISKGKYNRDSRQDLNNQRWGSTSQWAGRGAMLGSMFGPWGALIGAGVGALGGFIGGTINKQNTLKKNETRSAIGTLGYHLSGDYSRKEMEIILSAIKNGRGKTITEAEFSTFNKDLQDKILASGDNSLFPELRDIAVSTDNGKFDVKSASFTIQNGVFDKKLDKVTKANGGLLNGPSHKNGGMPILGSNVEVEGGEFVVNKRATAKNISLLNSINKMGDGGIIKPRRLENGGLLTVIPTGPTMSAYDRHRSRELERGKQDINLNISGTIKLEGSGGKTVDITDEMLKNPVFIRSLTKLIEKQMTINDKGGNVVKKGLYNT